MIQLKKTRERIILANHLLWPLIPIIQSTCSDDETDHEDCLDHSLKADPSRTPCHIRHIPWRSIELQQIFIILDKLKVRLDESIPKPSKSCPNTPTSQDKQYANNGRPSRPRVRCSNGSTSSLLPPPGLPIDCYSVNWLKGLTPVKRSQLEIDPISILSSIRMSLEK